MAILPLEAVTELLAHSSGHTHFLILLRDHFLVAKEAGCVLLLVLSEQLLYLG